MTTNHLLPFGPLLKRYRRAAEMSQEQLAERAGYSAVYIRKLEGGARRPTPATVDLLAHGLGLDQEEWEELRAAAERSAGSNIDNVPRRPEPSSQVADIHTFMLADIRDYTHFTEEHGDEAAARLTGTFARLAEEAVEPNGGEVVELRGDEVLAAFASPRGALRAAVALRQRCREIAEADLTLPLRVGIGLDAGEAVPVESGGYRGGALNLAARLCSLAGAGEIFASETVVSLARKVEDLAYRERGRVTLKGYAEPVSVVQVLPEPELEALSRRETYDAVLVADPTNGEIAARIAEQMEEAGLAAWTQGGATTLAAALHLTECVFVFLGPTGLDGKLRDELAAALDPLGPEWKPRVLLVLLPGVPDPFDPESLPSFLSMRTWIDLRACGAVLAATPLIHAVEGGIAPDRPTTVRTDVPPYRGLEVFDEESAEFYFGRAADVQRLVERLKGGNFLAVLGPSGSGKSSLVRAGLLPLVRRGGLPGGESWSVRVFVPGARPLTALAVQLARLHAEGPMQRTLDEMGRDSRTLHLASLLALADRPPRDRILWVVDQFEEVFTLCHDQQERQQFLANLLYAASTPDSRTVIVLTMRADFYHSCALYPDLAARVGRQQYLLGILERDALRQVIEEPAWRVGLEFEQGLVDRILEDVADQPGALPLLEYALLELWRRREGSILTLDAYRESGGVQGAIAQRAEATYGRFSPEEGKVARRILLRLTQAGEGTADTRRRVDMTELVTDSGAEQSVERVVSALIDARLLTAGRDEGEGERTVEVSHEALIRGWPRLRRWIDEDRVGLRTHRRLTEAAQEWRRLGRDAGGLYRGATLAVAREWIQRNPDALNQLEREFLDASVAALEAERRAARRRLWLGIGGLVAALLIISAVAVVAVFQSREAVRQRDAAISTTLADRAITQLATDRTLSTLIAVEAVRISRTDAAVTALRDALARFPAYRLLQGHEDVVRTASFSRDNRRIVTASNDGTARVWDVRSGQELAIFSPHVGAVNDAQFSPDGRLVVTADADGTARIWDIATRRVMHMMKERGAMAAAAFSPNGRWVLTAGADRTARLWDAATGRLVRVFRGHRYALTWAAFDPRGDKIITASDDGTARIWDATSGHPLHILTTASTELQSSVTSAAFSPDGRLALTTYGDGVRLWDVATGHLLGTLRGSTTVAVASATPNAIWSGTFSPDGRWIAAGSKDATARLWDARTGAPLTVLHDQVGSVNDVAFSPNEHWLVTARDDGNALVRVCDVCGSVDQLLALARQRVRRALTPDERRRYLAEP